MGLYKVACPYCNETKNVRVRELRFLSKKQVYRQQYKCLDCERAFSGLVYESRMALNDAIRNRTETAVLGRI